MSDQSDTQKNKLAATLIGPPALTGGGDGEDKSKVDIYTVTGSETLSELFDYRIDVWLKRKAPDSDEVPQPDFELTDLLGHTAAVKIPGVAREKDNQLQDAPTRYVHGLIVAAETLGIRNGRPAYALTMAPSLWLATRNRASRIFQGQTTLDVVKAVLRPYGIEPATRLFFTSDYRTWDYLTQYRETDYDFIRRILAFEGIYFFFEHTEKGHTMVLADSMSSHSALKDYEIVPMRQALRKVREPDYLDEWDDRCEIQTTSVRLGDHDFRRQRPTTPGRTQLESFANSTPPHAIPVDPKGPHWPLEIYDYPARLTLNENKPDYQNCTQEADRLAHVRLDEQQSRLKVFRGTGTARCLATGALFAIEGAKDAQYLITSTDLAIHNTATASQAPGSYGATSPTENPVRIGVCGMRTTGVFRPTYMPKPLVMGPQTGRVVGKSGEEIDTDKYGRIRVQMHWDRDGKFNEASSCWVRVAQPWAGNRWGVVFNPRIGNEVVVEFLEGDPDRPLVTGSVYNVDNMPPYTLSDNQTQSGIKTRSSKGGTDQNFNELRFEDKKGHEELHMQAERNMSTLVKANQSTTIGANRSVNIKKDDTLIIDGSRAVKVKGVMSVTVDGEVEGGGSDLIHSTQTVTGKHKLDASDTIEICAPNMITLKCGDTSITLEPEKITLKAAGGGQIVLTTDIKADSDGGSTLQLDAKALLGGKSAATVDGGPETTVKGGSGSVKLDGGGVTVTGPTIKLNS